MNNLAMLRTRADNRQRQARGHELLLTGPDAGTGIYGSEGWGFESLRARPGQQAIAILQRLLLLPMGPIIMPLEQLIASVGRLLAKRVDLALAQLPAPLL